MIEGLKTLEFHLRQLAVLLASGRPEDYRAATETWLSRFGLARHAALLMRADGDFRPDAVVKREIYETTIAGHYSAWTARC